MMDEILSILIGTLFVLLIQIVNFMYILKRLYYIIFFIDYEMVSDKFSGEIPRRK